MIEALNSWEYRRRFSVARPSCVAVMLGAHVKNRWAPKLPAPRGSGRWVYRTVTLKSSSNRFQLRSGPMHFYERSQGALFCPGSYGLITAVCLIEHLHSRLPTPDSRACVSDYALQLSGSVLKLLSSPPCQDSCRVS
jgi:hypothetical protein